MKLFLSAIAFLAAVALGVSALAFACLPVFQVTSWGWWSLILIPCSWVAALVFFLATLGMGVIATESRN